MPIITTRPYFVIATFLEQQKIQASDKVTNDYFGFSVSISGDGNTAIGGSYQEGSNKGAAYIFTKSGSTWTEQQKITSGTYGDQLGYSVSISGDGNTAICGARYEDTGRIESGAAYIFTRTGSPGVWTEQQKLKASDPGTGDHFGVSVSISSDGNTCIVGSSAGSMGAAYVFSKTGSTWTEQQKITSDDIQLGDEFGNSVAISGDGNTCIVGAYFEDSPSSNTGAAYVFARSGSPGVWTQQEKLLASDRSGDDHFGNSVAISGDGNTAIVGAHYEDTGGVEAGAAYIFTRTGSPEWSEQQKIQSSDIDSNDQFGQDVSLNDNGNTAIVGARYVNIGGSTTGAAYIFTRAGATWSEQQKILASDKGSGDYFGTSVSLSNDGLSTIIGAWGEDTGGSRAGAAYIFTK
jgi:hypothetical protein